VGDERQWLVPGKVVVGRRFEEQCHLRCRLHGRCRCSSRRAPTQHLLRRAAGPAIPDPNSPSSATSSSPPIPSLAQNKLARGHGGALSQMEITVEALTREEVLTGAGTTAAWPGSRACTTGCTGPWPKRCARGTSSTSWTLPGARSKPSSCPLAPVPRSRSRRGRRRC
jgi:hypothetical protein